jgi:hypothetical protein
MGVMSMFALHFNTDNSDVFGETEAETRYEIANILTSIADYVRNGGINFPHGGIRDKTGNKIGEWKLMGRHGIGDEAKP